VKLSERIVKIKEGRFFGHSCRLHDYPGWGYLEDRTRHDGYRGRSRLHKAAASAI